MANIKKEVYEDLINKYKAKIQGELEGHVSGAPISPERVRSQDYIDFKKEIIPPQQNAYEKACAIAQKFLNIKPDKKTLPKLQESIESAHLNISPTGSASFAILLPLLIAMVGGMVSFLVFQSLPFVFLMIILGLIIYRPASNIPNYIANYWRLKASNQMVLCIFYVVTYMRHTSNLENAIQFASEHLTPPLSLDMKKVIWDVETQKYGSLKDSLDNYLNSWRKYNMEFVESFHLIESSLLEPQEERRLGTLDKALDVILDETYEKMLHYAHNLKSPITMLHMLGVILPILGLVILPLIISFMGNVRWYHIAFFYNLVIPLVVYFMGKSILTKRPTGYGDTDITEENPELKKYKNIIIKLGGKEIQINPLTIAIVVGAILLFIGLFPLILNLLASPGFDVSLDLNTRNVQEAKFLLLQYVEDKDTGRIVGPFGLGASILSLGITCAVGIGIGLFFKLRSKNVIQIRKATKQLEDEFASALFQLGNRLGDDLPAEIAFSRVADYMQNTTSGKFFRLVSINIQKLGMGVSQAIFDPKYGALNAFPSKIIESSMKVLIESIKKGPRVAAQALTNVARYIKEIHRVNERLRDLMADIMSSMQSQIKFLAPAISGIVVGITSMITSILLTLITQMDVITGGGGDQINSTFNITEMFTIGIPTFYFQVVVGIYVVQIVYILTVLANGIENGSDKLNERFTLGVNLIRSTILYCLIAGFVMILFNIIASQILGSSLATTY